MVGGLLILITVMFGGDTDVDLDADMDMDIDLDADMDMDIDLDADAGENFNIKPDIDTGLWLPFFSLRFWIFGSAFFGLTGVLLTNLRSLTGFEGQFMIAFVSTVTGLFTGTASAYTFQWLKKSEANSMVKIQHYIGRTAHITLPFDAQSKGKIKLDINSQQLDFIAETDEPQGFQRDDLVTIIAIEDGIARVVKNV